MVNKKTGKSSLKRTRDFLKKGNLAGQIEARHKKRAFQAKVKGRAVQRNKGGKKVEEVNEEEGIDEADLPVKKGSDDDESDEELDVDAVLGGEGLDEEEDEEEDAELEDDDLSDLGSDDDTKHMMDLKALAEKDPEFYKYLQENDAELLDFDAEGPVAGGSDEDDSEEEDSEDESEDDEMDAKAKKGKGKEKEAKPVPVLTKEVLKGWQKNLLETRSIRALRKLLLAFRSAATSGGAGSEAADERWDIQSAAVFNKLVTTTLKYTPVILAQQVPYKENNGKYKIATNTKQYATAQRLLKSYFVSLQALLNTVAQDSGIPALAVSESAKLVPYIVGNRKVARGWLKMLIGVFETSAEDVRVAAFLALRKLAVAGDSSLREAVIKGVYATILASSRQTGIYTLPMITLMKNAGSELFNLPGKAEGEQAYQLAFSYIRMLAILLRKGVKEGSKDAFKAVYNWQFVHAIDFWSLVLSSACDKERAIAGTPPSPLQQLLYPLIQTAIGAIRLVPTSRYYPLRFHLTRALLRIVQRTGTYIPLSTPLFEILDSPDLTRRSKPATLKPLDWEYYIRCPAAYLKTRVYADGLADELVYLLTEYYGALATSIAFPELVLPAVVSLKRHQKKSGQARLASQVKVLVEKVEANAKWIEEKREKIEFAPNKRDKVNRFLHDVDPATTPLGGFLRVQKKVRENKRLTLEKAAQGDGDDL